MVICIAKIATIMVDMEEKKIKINTCNYYIIGCDINIRRYLFLLFNEKNKYEDYNTYNETNKQYGTVQHYEKENDDFYISLYYPKLKRKEFK